MASGEKVPDTKFKSEETEQKKIFVSKTHLIIAIVVFIVVAVAVGLIAGLTGRGQTPVTTTNPTIATTEDPKNALLTNPRLPGKVKPTNYYFALDIDMTNLKFDGINIIQIDVIQPTNMIIVHADNIAMRAAPQVGTNRYFDSSSTLTKVIDHGKRMKNNYYYAVLEKALTTGTYYIQYNYTAPLSNDLNGLYKYQYTRASDRQQIWAVASQCEDFYARRIIPCFDEPAMKATFQANITVPNNYTALWNTRETSIVSVGNKRRYEYGPTPIMSTYLLAFTVDDFQPVQTNTNRGTLIRVFSRPSIRDDGMYALQAAKNITELYESYTGIDYPLPKQDHVSVPAFDSGAMENWGLILYREEYLSYNSSYINSNGLETIVTIISHELAHMWFGNLVTLQWWNHLWLNEAFATFFGSFIADKVETSMYLMQQFTIDDVQTGFASDATPFSHPIVPPSTFGPYFDRITYQKGGSVLRMLRGYIGENNFDTGLRTYLSTYKYKNTVTEQLFQTWSSSINNQFNISDFMGPWVYQMGYPLVTLSRHPTKAGTGLITQKRYLTNASLDSGKDAPGSPFKSSFGYKWTIPVKYFYQNSVGIQQVVFSKNNANTEVTWPANTWIHLNSEQMGFYRVNYPTDNWNALASQLQSDKTKFKNTDIASMMDDAFQFAENKRVSYNIPLNLTKYMSKETNYLPWDVVSSYFFTLQLRLNNRKSYIPFSKYYRKITAGPADQVQFMATGGWMAESARYTILNSACSTGYMPCIKNASAIYRDFMQDPVANDIPGVYRSIVFRWAMAYADGPAWDFLFKRYQDSLDITEKGRILYALSYSRTPWILRRFLNYSTDPTKMPSSSTGTVFLYVSRNPVGRYVAWDYYLQNVQYFVKRYGTSRYIPNLITRNFNRQLGLNEVKRFFAYHPDKSAYARFNEPVIIRRIEANIKYLKDFEDTLTTWFTNNVNDVTSM